jgi:hypothetical protein
LGRRGAALALPLVALLAGVPRVPMAVPQRLPRDAELPAFEPGCGAYCEREVDEVEWQGGRAYLHLGVRRDASS